MSNFSLPTPRKGDLLPLGTTIALGVLVVLAAYTYTSWPTAEKPASQPESATAATTSGKAETAKSDETGSDMIASKEDNAVVEAMVTTSNNGSVLVAPAATLGSKPSSTSTTKTESTTETRQVQASDPNLVFGKASGAGPLKSAKVAVPKATKPTPSKSTSSSASTSLSASATSPKKSTATVRVSPSGYATPTTTPFSFNNPTPNSGRAAVASPDVSQSRAVIDALTPLFLITDTPKE